MPALATILEKLGPLADRLQAPTLLVVRLLAGVSFLTHGAVKLADPQGTAETFAGYGLPVPLASALAAGATEALGGLLLAAGAFARPAALALAVTMGVALLTAHGGRLDPKPAAHLAAAWLVLAFGPGPWSVDARRAGRTTA